MRLQRDILAAVTTVLAEIQFNQNNIMTDTEKLIRSTKRVIRGTSQGKLNELLAERSRWKRKETIAANKLASVQKQIEVLAAEMAAKLLTSELI